MDLNLAGLRDRRIAASDETLSVANERIYGQGSAARSVGAARARRTDRRPDAIQAIVLHKTAGQRLFLPGTRSAYPGASGDGNVRSNHDIDKITAHFVVINDGTVFYTHDVEFILNDAGGRLGIDIEFAGNFPVELRPGALRLDPRAIRAGRELVRALTRAIPTITHIHPHGQVQKYERNRRLRRTEVCGGPDHANPCGKLHTCPGPDIWVNVGMWAAARAPNGLGLICDTTVDGYQNNTITPTQSNPEYDQHVS